MASMNSEVDVNCEDTASHGCVLKVPTLQNGCLR